MSGRFFAQAILWSAVAVSLMAMVHSCQKTKIESDLVPRTDQKEIHPNTLGPDEQGESGSLWEKSSE